LKIDLQMKKLRLEKLASYVGYYKPGKSGCEVHKAYYGIQRDAEAGLLNYFSVSVNIKV
jgi:hypothetical protein